jgi:hypothetical protein
LERLEFRIRIGDETDGFGSAGFGASGADEIENGFCGFREIGV